MTARAMMHGALAALALAIAGCGAASTPDKGGERSNRLVDFAKKPPYVNALDIDPQTKEIPADHQPRLLSHRPCRR